VGRAQLEGGLIVLTSSKGFSLLETIVALGVLTTGVLGAAAVLASGMQKLSSSPEDVVTTQKAAEAMEAVFSARQSGKLTWTQINNVSNGGVFLDGPQSLYKPGADGLVNTADDTAVGNGIETVRLPGKDQTLNTADDQIITLTTFTREIKIVDVPSENAQLRSITVTVTYKDGPTIRKYTLTTYISAYS
jgi:type II secretory pathway pseudopilin PulG